jgi:hypothetical protein
MEKDDPENKSLLLPSTLPENQSESLKANNVVDINGEPFTRSVSEVHDLIEHHVSNLRDMEALGVRYETGIYISIGFDAEGTQMSTTNYMTNSSKIPPCVLPEIAKTMVNNKMLKTMLEDADE